MGWNEVLSVLARSGGDPDRASAITEQMLAQDRQREEQQRALLTELAMRAAQTRGGRNVSFEGTNIPQSFGEGAFEDPADAMRRGVDLDIAKEDRLRGARNAPVPMPEGQYGPPQTRAQAEAAEVASRIENEVGAKYRAGEPERTGQRLIDISDQNAKQLGAEKLARIQNEGQIAAAEAGAKARGADAQLYFKAVALAQTDPTVKEWQAQLDMMKKSFEGKMEGQYPAGLKAQAADIEARIQRRVEQKADEYMTRFASVAR